MRPRESRAAVDAARDLQGFRLLLGALRDLGEDVAAGEDQELFAVDGDLGAAVLRVDDGVTDLEVERDHLAGLLAPPPRSDREDFALLRLLFGGVGDDEAADGRLLGLPGPDDDAVLEGLELHGGPPGAVSVVGRKHGR